MSQQLTEQEPTMPTGHHDHDFPHLWCAAPVGAQEGLVEAAPERFARHGDEEPLGRDPRHLGRMGVAFVRGAQRHVIASVKHFALNSIEDTRMTVSANVDERSGAPAT